MDYQKSRNIINKHSEHDSNVLKEIYNKKRDFKNIKNRDILEKNTNKKIYEDIEKKIDDYISKITTNK